MASRTLTEAEVRRIIDGARVGRPLPLLYFLEDIEARTWRALAFLLQCRRNGFMVILPPEPRVSEQMQKLIDGAGPAVETPIMAELQVDCETHRKRAVGKIKAIFCDFPWALQEGSAGAGRYGNPTSTDDRHCRDPPPRGAGLAADSWVQEVLTGEITESGLAEYFTGSPRSCQSRARTRSPPSRASRPDLRAGGQVSSAPDVATSRRKGPAARSVFGGAESITGTIPPQEWSPGGCGPARGRD